jgi:hypothetical protein
LQKDILKHEKADKKKAKELEKKTKELEKLNKPKRGKKGSVKTIDTNNSTSNNPIDIDMKTIDEIVRRELEKL